MRARGQPFGSVTEKNWGESTCFFFIFFCEVNLGQKLFPEESRKIDPKQQHRGPFWIFKKKQLGGLFWGGLPLDFAEKRSRDGRGGRIVLEHAGVPKSAKRNHLSELTLVLKIDSLGDGGEYFSRA